MSFSPSPPHHSPVGSMSLLVIPDIALTRILDDRFLYLLLKSRTLTQRALNQFLCKAVNCAWTVRVKSHFKPLFTILVENGGYNNSGGHPENLSR
jgi:hypothetical protein